MKGLKNEKKDWKVILKNNRHLSQAELARKYGASSSVISTACKRHHIPLLKKYPNTSPSVEVRIIKLYKQGVKISEIATKIKKSLSTIYRVLKRNGEETSRIWRGEE